MRNWFCRSKSSTLLVVFLVNLLVISLFIEGLVALLFVAPSLTRLGLRDFIRTIYREEIRNLIHLEPACARYDPELAYTLRPGEFFFSNPEFSNKFSVNSLGVRDDESSLDGPEIIIAGDSLAMGWGVDQDETYAQIIERTSGRKVLNAAIASYGTVREMRILDRIDTTKLKYLVIHYVGNDYRENKVFYGKGTLPISSEAKYNRISKNYLGKRGYYPGKYFVSFLRCFLGNIKLPKFKPKPDQARFFLNALSKAGNLNLDGVKIIVVGFDPFISELERNLKAEVYPIRIRDMSIINLSGKVKRGCRYLIDGHCNSKGHRVIADEVLKVIN